MTKNLQEAPPKDAKGVDQTKRFFISDTHFGHKNVLKYDHATRPFSSIEEHDETIIRLWNETVPAQGNSIVYHLGDFAHNKSVFSSIVPRLNGTIVWIRGNHDDETWKLRHMVSSAHEAKYIRCANKQRMYLSHYPMRSWRGSYVGAIHLHGHCHGALESIPWGKSMDVSANVIGLRPISEEQVIERLKDRPFVDHHQIFNPFST